MSKNNKVDREKVFSVGITCALLLTLGIGVFSVIRGTNAGSENENNIVNLNDQSDNNVAIHMEEANLSDWFEEDLATEDLSSEDSVEIITENMETIADDAQEKVSLNPKETEVQDVAGKAAMDPLSKYSFQETSTMLWPIQGEIVKKYSMDSTVYYDSLGVYRVNPAIMIRAKVGDKVGAAAGGIVQTVSQNEETGLTLVVGLGNGYEAIYGQLTDVNLKAGDIVAEGQLIGVVANPTAYYEKEGAHVYFAVTKDGEPVDPFVFLTQE